jgi:mycofactocin precursor
METRQDWETKSSDPQGEEPRILEEISIEEVFVDGICGVY